MKDKFQKDEVLKAYFSRQQHLGKLLQEAQRLMGKYESELLDENDPGDRSKFNRRKGEIQKDINSYLEEISSLDQKIESHKTTIESLHKSYLISPLSVQAEDSQTDQEVTNFTLKIQSPFIRELEIRLRTEVAYWQKSGFQIPDKSKRYTASYFSFAWKKLEFIGSQLQICSYEEQKSILDQIESHILHVSELISGTTQHQLSSTLYIELQRVTKEIEIFKSTVRKIQFTRLNGSQPPAYLLKSVDTKKASLEISLKEVQGEFKKLVDDAYAD